MTARNDSNHDTNKYPFAIKIVAERAQLAPLKVSNGDFARGRKLFLPNELFKLNIPLHELPDVPFHGAPFMQNGQLMRVVGLYGPKRMPYRCWPIGAEPQFHQFLIDNGMKRGWHIQEEWMVKLGIEEQDQVFHTTCKKLKISPVTSVAIPDLPAAAPVDPLAGLSPAERKLVSEMRAKAAVGASGAASGFMADLQLLRRCDGKASDEKLSLGETAHVANYMYAGRDALMKSADRWVLFDGMYHHKGALLWTFEARKGEFEADVVWMAYDFQETKPLNLCMLGLGATYPEQIAALMPEWVL